MKGWGKIEWFLIVITALAIAAGIKDAAAAERTYDLHTEAYPVGMTENNTGIYTYWIVEWSWLDCAGNVHRVREDVDVVGRGNQNAVIQEGLKKLLARKEVNEILASVCENPPKELNIQ